MTFYEVLREVAPRSFRHILNPMRTDGRWFGDTPDEAAKAASAYEATISDMKAGHFGGVYKIVPQHRFTSVAVDFDGNTSRFQEHPFADG